MKEIVVFVVVVGFIISILLCAFGGKIGELFLFFIPKRVRVRGTFICCFCKKEQIIISPGDPIREMRFTGYTHFLIIKSEDEKEYELMIPNDLYRQIKNQLQEKKGSFLEAHCRHGKNYDLVAIKCKVK